MLVQPHLDERVVARIWESQAYDVSPLDALGLSVVFRGVPSDAGGPDYQDAVLSVRDRVLQTGDIEFHTRASDWYRHEHHLNPNYNRVVLHVVWWNDTADTMREDGIRVPVLALDSHASPGYEYVESAPKQQSLSQRCVDTLSCLTRESVVATVRDLGEKRFRMRAARYEADLTVEDPDQVAWAALLEGLGFASNRRAFIALADAVPYRWLLTIPAGERLATVLDAAGLGPIASTPPPARLPAETWRLARLRPANHPARRLQGILTILAACRPSLALSLQDAVHRAERASQLRDVLLVRDGGPALIGAGRADELIVSVVLPLVAALDSSDDRPFTLFQGYPAAPSNRWTRYMLGLMREAGHGSYVVRGAREHQGWHHLYHTYCRCGNGRACPLCRAAVRG